MEIVVFEPTRRKRTLPLLEKVIPKVRDLGDVMEVDLGNLRGAYRKELVGLLATMFRKGIIKRLKIRRVAGS